MIVPTLLQMNMNLYIFSSRSETRRYRLCRDRRWFDQDPRNQAARFQCVRQGAQHHVKRRRGRGPRLRAPVRHLVANIPREGLYHHRLPALPHHPRVAGIHGGGEVRKTRQDCNENCEKNLFIKINKKEELWTLLRLCITLILRSIMQRLIRKVKNF